VSNWPPRRKAFNCTWGRRDGAHSISTCRQPPHLFCTIDKLPSGIVRENYDLSGKTEPQSQMVIKAVVQLFNKRAAKHTAMALVVDRYAQAHLNFQWDDFVLEEVTELEAWPMFMGFSKRLPSSGIFPQRTSRRTAATTSCSTRPRMACKSETKGWSLMGQQELLKFIVGI
jgi:hypothetical protein